MPRWGLPLASAGGPSRSAALRLPRQPSRSPRPRRGGSSPLGRHRGSARAGGSTPPPPLRRGGSPPSGRAQLRLEPLAARHVARRRPIRGRHPHPDAARSSIEPTPVHQPSRSSSLSAATGSCYPGRRYGPTASSSCSGTRRPTWFGAIRLPTAPSRRRSATIASRPRPRGERGAPTPFQPPATSTPTPPYLAPFHGRAAAPWLGRRHGGDGGRERAERIEYA